MRFLLAFLLVAFPAFGQFAPWQPVVLAPVVSACPAYSGPGDVVAFDFWWGLRAYSSAIATTGTQKLIQVRRASDNTTQDTGMVCGALDSASASTFAGTDASGTGSITLTTLTFTGGHVGDTVTCGTCAAGTYIVSGSSPTWTVNISQTVASTTITLTWGLFVAKIYDQVGGQDMVQATSALQPQLLLTGGPSSTMPHLVLTSSQMATAGAVGVNQGFTLQYVGQRRGSAMGTAMYSSTNNVVMGYASSANTFELFAGANPTVTVSDNAWHQILANFNGASSIVQVNATVTSSLNVGAAGFNNSLMMFAHSTVPTTPIIGNWVEGGVATGNMSSGNRNSLDTQVQAYWGF